jgi:hypothetical protein
MRYVNRLQFAARFAVRDELGYLRDYQLLWRAFMVAGGRARPAGIRCPS